MTYWTDKVVLITGGAAGLGLRLARHFAQSGAQLVLADRDERALAQGEQLVGTHGGRVCGVVADVTDQHSVENLFATVDAQAGRLDVLVNCAGRSGRGMVLETEPSTFQAFLDLNFFATVRCTRCAAPRLLETRGHLVNIGSLAAKMAASYLGAYPVSKFAVAAYSQQLRLELGPRGLHVLLVCPGPIAREDAGGRYADQAGGLPAAAQRPGGGVRLRGLDPDVLARRILQACVRRQPELVLPASARWLAAINQLWPAWGDRIITRMTR